MVALTDQKGWTHLIAFVSAFVVFALPMDVMARGNKTDLVKELYVKSGMAEQIRQIPNIFLDGFEQAVEMHVRLKRLPRGILKAYRASLEKNFKAEDIKNRIFEECTEKLSVQDLKKILEWLDSSIGRKFAQLEKASATAEGFSNRSPFEAQNQKPSSPEDRLEALRKMDALFRATDTGVELAMKTQLMVLIALVAHLPSEKQPETDELVAAIHKNRSLFEDVLYEETQVFLRNTYHTVTTVELEKYIAFASSPAGGRYYHAVSTGLSKALLEGCCNWRASIADILKRDEKRSIQKNDLRSQTPI